MKSPAKATNNITEAAVADQRYASAAMLVEYITRADVLAGGDSFAELYGRPPGEVVSDRALDMLVEELMNNPAWQRGCRILGFLQFRSLRRLPPFGTFPANMSKAAVVHAIVSSRAWGLGVLLSKSSAPAR